MSLLLSQLGGGGGSSVNATPGTGAIIYTGQSPTIQTPLNLSPGTGVITYTGFSPSIQTPVVILPGTGAVVFTGFSPTIQVPLNITPGVGAVVYAGFSPTVELPVVVLPGVGAITYSGFNPTVTTGAGVTVIPGTGVIVYNGYSPVIELPINLTPGVGSIIFDGFSATIQTPVNVLPGFGQITYDGFIPIVSISSSGSSPVFSLSLNQLTPEEVRRREIRQFIRSGVEAITPSLEFNEGIVSDFAAQRSNDYPATLLVLEENQTSIEYSAPIDSWRIKIAIFQIDKLDSIPEQYEDLVDACDEIAQKLIYKYRNTIEGYKKSRITDLSRKKFVKSPTYGPDCLTGIELSFTLISPDQTNVC